MRSVNKKIKDLYKKHRVKVKSRTESVKLVKQIELNTNNPASYVTSLGGKKMDFIYFSEKLCKKHGYCVNLVAAHELIHWTGHKSRLNRRAINKIKTPREHVKEELIAIIGADILLRSLGLNTDQTITNMWDLLEDIEYSDRDFDTATRKAIDVCKYLMKEKRK